MNDGTVLPAKLNMTPDPCIEDPKLTQNSLRVLKARYLQKGGEGKIIETPRELFARVGTAIAHAEASFGNDSNEAYWREAFQRLLTSLDFLPNSPTLMNAGMPGGQLSACFVIPVPDSMSGIFEALKQAALVQQTGGGTGFSFSHLRPKGDVVKSTGGEASGPVSFMMVFDAATEHIKQGGKRRGANMGILRVDHPDILEFVTAKTQEGTLENFNISVGATDVFLDAVRKNTTYELKHPRTGRPVDRIAAPAVFEAIIESAWKTGDPGMVFLDAINRTNPTPSLGQYEATNPCGEIPLLPNEACNLGSINLAHHLLEHSEIPSIDWEKLRTTVHTAVRFLDDLIEVNQFPTPAIERISKGNRKVGLGVMGFAELLIRLGIPYDSDQAVQVGEQLMQLIATEARNASKHLAKERGTFPNWPHSVFKDQDLPLRNATCTAIAPTGTISLIAGTTPGIEPLFSLITKRSHSLGGNPLYEMAPLLDQYWPQPAFPNDHEPHEKWASLPEKVRRLYVTALEISPEGHLAIQAAFQRHVDNSVSKTINLPNEAKPEDVGHAYWRAWELGLKGVTVFRYGSKGKHVLEMERPNGVPCRNLGQCQPC